MVGARAKEGKGGLAPFPFLFGKFQHGAFASKNICAPEENACTAGYMYWRILLATILYLRKTKDY